MTTKNFIKWLVGLFKPQYIDLKKIHQLKEKGITPLFIFASFQEGSLKLPSLTHLNKQVVLK